MNENTDTKERELCACCGAFYPKPGSIFCRQCDGPPPWKSSPPIDAVIAAKGDAT